jgi:hypothetical protein
MSGMSFSLFGELFFGMVMRIFPASRGPGYAVHHNDGLPV